MPKSKDFGFVFWMHLLVLCLMYSSPFLFSWQLILIGVILYFLQLLVFGGCVLTIKELGEDRKEGFNAYYLRKLGFKVNETKLKIVLSLVPWILLFVALVWQVVLKHTPYLEGI